MIVEGSVGERWGVRFRGGWDRVLVIGLMFCLKKEREVSGWLLGFEGGCWKGWVEREGGGNTHILFGY